MSVNHTAVHAQASNPRVLTIHSPHPPQTITKALDFLSKIYNLSGLLESHKTIKTNSNSSLRVNYFPEIAYKFNYLYNGSSKFQGSIVKGVLALH